MKTKMKGLSIRFIRTLVPVLLGFCMMTAGNILAADEELAHDAGTQPVFTDIAVLSTTDMHGKCWETNLLTDDAETNNMLRVSDAVNSIREKYGAGNVLLVDNGDLFQGTPVSEVQLADCAEGKSDLPLAMALCLKEIGYDAFVLGNHEFNFGWNVMKNAYDYLEENGIPVLAANVCYDGTDGAHEAGENAFRPYVIKEILAGGHPHKIGILGLENSDITRWDLPVNYPGLMFAHPGNETFSIAREAERYLPEMEKEGCEFIIAAYHGGLGTADRELAFGDNSESQGLRLIEGTNGLNMVIVGHDHSSGYSNDTYPDKSGKMVTVVNGGGQELTETIIRFSEDEAGALHWEFVDSRNLKLEDFDVDETLQEKMQPYADLAQDEVSKPIGEAAGDWDESTDFYTSQTDTIDLINSAMMEISTLRLAEKYGENGAQDLGIQGLDHLDVDLSMTSVVVSNNYVVKPGGISVRDIYRLYRFANNLLVLPLSGSQIRAIMEENAAQHLTTRVYGGEVYYYTKNDNFTNLIFGGINFTYDMARPEGERVQIKDFSNGRPFEEDRIYLVAVNNYILGNERCGLRDYVMEDAVWSQLDEADGETIQDIIIEYIRKKSEENRTILPDSFNWTWSMDYSAAPNDLPAWEGELAAMQTSHPEEEGTYVLYQEASGNALTQETVNGGLGAVECEAWGDALTAPLSPDALRFVVRQAGDDKMYIQTVDGLYLTSASTGGLSLEKEPADDDLSLWELKSAPGGWNIVNAGEGIQAMEYYSGRFTTYKLSTSGSFVFNFYQIL